MSLPLRECGLKLHRLHGSEESEPVTPLAGVWIEILKLLWESVLVPVTPLAGVWIEITQ